MGATVGSVGVVVDSPVPPEELSSTDEASDGESPPVEEVEASGSVAPEVGVTLGAGDTGGATSAYDVPTV